MVGNFVFLIFHCVLSFIAIPSSLYDSERSDVSPDYVPGRDMDMIDGAERSPPTIAPAIGVGAGVRSVGAPGMTSTPAGASARHESVFAGGTYELEHPVNHLGNDLRNDALVGDDDEDSRYC